MEVISKIHYKIKSENSGVKVSSVRKTKEGGVLAKLGPKVTNKATLWEVVKSLLEEKALVSTLETACSLEILYIDCLTEKTEVGYQPPKTRYNGSCRTIRKETS